MCICHFISMFVPCNFRLPKLDIRLWLCCISTSFMPVCSKVRFCLCQCAAYNTKIPLRITSKRDCRAPDGNRTLCDCQLVTLLTSGFTSGKVGFFVKSAFIDHPASQMAVLREIECSRWLSQMKRRFFRDVSPHLHEQPLQHLLLPWQSAHFLSIPEDFVPC